MIVIDVRSNSEYNEGHLTEAINIPVDHFIRGQLPDELKKTDKDEHIILYCRSGSRADMVRSSLNRHGFTNIENCINMHQAEMRLKR